LTSTYRLGGVPEWLIGAVSKTVVGLVFTVGSNPTPSAYEKDPIRMVGPLIPLNIDQNGLFVILSKDLLGIFLQ
jgi:hypothetical protein